MAQSRPQERSVRRAIRKELVQLGGYWMAVHGSPYQPRAIDMVGCYRGRFVGLELKRPGGKPTARQSVTIKQIQDAGGIAGVVRSKVEVRSLLSPLTSLPPSDNVILVQPRRHSERRESMTPKKSAAVEEDEDLEDLDDLGEEAEETETKSRRTRSRRVKASTATKAAKADDGIGVKEVAEAAGVSTAEVRRYLRSLGDTEHETRARYHFSSLSSPEVKGIVKALAQKDGSSAKAPAKAEAKASTKATKGRGKTKKSKKSK